MAKSKHYYIRKTHRWMGVLLGIQLFLLRRVYNLKEVLRIVSRGTRGRCGVTQLGC